MTYRVVVVNSKFQVSDSNYWITDVVFSSTETHQNALLSRIMQF